MCLKYYSIDPSAAYLSVKANEVGGLKVMRKIVIEDEAFYFPIYYNEISSLMKVGELVSAIDLTQTHIKNGMVLGDYPPGFHFYPASYNDLPTFNFLRHFLEDSLPHGKSCTLFHGDKNLYYCTEIVTVHANFYNIVVRGVEEKYTDGRVIFFETFVARRMMILKELERINELRD